MKKKRKSVIEAIIEIRLRRPPIGVFIRVSPFELKVSLASVERKSKRRR